jgi:hypothetical protein
LRRLAATTAAVLAAASVIVAPALVRAAPSGAAARCAGGYDYAGLASRGGVRGVAATIEAVRMPLVASGHAAAWVGVGDRREWLQAGIAAFPRVGLRLYVEARAPGRQRRFVDLGAARARHGYRVAVLEVAPGRWQASVDGQSVGAVVPLPAPQGTWRGIATAETWSAGRVRCNRYRYSFDEVSVLEASGWSSLSAAERLGSPVDRGSRGFAAAA